MPLTLFIFSYFTAVTFIEVIIISFSGNYFLFTVDNYHHFNVFYYEDLFGIADHPDLYNDEYMNSKYRTLFDYQHANEEAVKTKYQHEVNPTPVEDPNSRLNKVYNYQVWNKGTIITLGGLCTFLCAGALIGGWWYWLSFIWGHWRYW